jgi:hypothetical protein
MGIIKIKPTGRNIKKSAVWEVSVISKNQLEKCKLQLEKTPHQIAKDLRLIKEVHENIPNFNAILKLQLYVQTV